MQCEHMKNDRSGLGLLAKEYEENPSYKHTRTHVNMVPWALGATRHKKTTWTGPKQKLFAITLIFVNFGDIHYIYSFISFYGFNKEALWPAIHLGFNNYPSRFLIIFAELDFWIYWFSTAAWAWNVPRNKKAN